MTKVDLRKASARGLLSDRGLHNFLRPELSDTKVRTDFIKKCLIKMKTRRMLLRAQWYTEIADDQEKVRNNRPALKIIFLIGLAEALAKVRVNNRMQSLEAIKEFFKYILPRDKKFIQQHFRRTLLSYKHHSLSFLSVIKILYDIRNKAVHGEDYYSFSLMNADRKKEYQSKYTDYGFITFAELGKRYRKRRVSLDISLTYEELRDIFRRTAIENIKSLF